MRMHDRLRRYTTPIVVGCAVAVAPTLAVGLDSKTTPGVTPEPAQHEANENSKADDKADRMEAQELIDQATAVVERMSSDPDVAALLRDSKGVYIVPDFTRAALGVGGEGGDGVMLTHGNGGWSGPAFYDVGGLTVGLEAGISNGEIAFILMSDKAVQNFREKNKFSLSADAGYDILNYSANAGTSWGKGDVVTWSDTEGLFAGAGLGVADIHWNADRNSKVYGAGVTPDATLTGAMKAEQAAQLRGALPG